MPHVTLPRSRMQPSFSSLSLAPGAAVAVIRVDVRVNREFDYRVPSALLAAVTEGSRVRIPFGHRTVLGTVISLRASDAASAAPEALKPILEVIGASAMLTPPLLDLAKWMADYYLCSLDLTLRCVTPAIVRNRASIRRRAARRDAELEQAAAELLPTRPLDLMPQQSAALERVLAAAQSSPAHPILLFGVTGSGKTEVYLQAMDRLMKEGRGAIFLVPEIALTPQTVERLRARFDSVTPGATEAGAAGLTASGAPSSIRSSPLAVLHSGLSQGERFREWQRIRSGEAQLVVGARSAVFAPVRNLGLIVVDEEHENTYKQEEAPRYHARDVAVMRGRLENAVVVLGSATPSLESFHNTRAGKYELCRMPERIDGRKLPWIRVVDMRREMMRQKGFSVFSEPLKTAIHLRLERHEQVILYLNRRGYASSMICKKCGYVAACPNCSVSLSYHRNEQRLRCHFCGLTQAAPTRCPQKDCRDPSIRYAGLGTEKLEEVVTKLFPHARLARMDSDTMTRRGDYERTLLRFKTGKTDILLGTQMIAKGLDFPRVTLVGIVYADVGLHFPDFRSGERTFQQITQVAGRAGRGDVEGEVVVQTFTPHHSAIQFGRRQDFEGFYAEECAFRQSLDYPPFNHLTKIEFCSPQESRAEFAARRFCEKLTARVGPSLRVLGPSPAPLARLRGNFRYHLLIRDGRRKGQKAAIESVLREFPRESDVTITADVDPLQML